jgi:site-specific DNA-cytosine methylase
MNGAFSVADPRFNQSAKWRDGQAFGEHRWGDATGSIAGQQGPGQGAYAVSDPRHMGKAKHSNEFAVVPWDRSARAITGAHGSGACVADPRDVFAVPDPNVLARQAGDAYLTGGHYGVIAWEQTAGAVSAAAGHDNGRWSVADPRPMPAGGDKLVAVIRSLDNTWHRPFTTLELAALQSLIEPEEHFELEGLSDKKWRERIGNAVPPNAAQAVAELMGTTLLLAWAGETFALSAAPIWVRSVAVALTLPSVQEHDNSTTPGDAKHG